MKIIWENKKSLRIEYTSALFSEFELRKLEFNNIEFV